MTQAADQHINEFMEHPFDGVSESLVVAGD
jgi:hypothetical protein